MYTHLRGRGERRCGIHALIHFFLDRFIDSEKWRKDFGTDDLVRNFVYVEKPKVFEYYPQYYHKTDKVRPHSFHLCLAYPG